MKSGRTIMQVALLAILGVAVLGSTLRIAQMRGNGPFLQTITEVEHLLSTRAVEKVDDSTLQNAAIQGMVKAIGDPHSVYIPPTKSDDFAKQMIGEYVGIGAQVTIENGWLTIVTPLDGSPALKAGLKPDDRIVKIEGESTLGKSVSDCVDLLKGKPGTAVKVLIERDKKQKTIEIIRDHINTVQVKGIERIGENQWQFMLDPKDKIGYIALTQFTPGCAKEIHAALDSIGAEDGSLKGLIFDLRWNPGGVLQEAVELADLFLDEGIIVSTRGRVGKEQIDRAHKPGTLPDFPVLILLNEYSASASEVFSGALVENNRAVVLGVRSYGKGSVQSIIPLHNLPGAMLKLTDRGYYLPSGKSLQRKDDSLSWGVDPSAGFYVPLTDAQTRDVIMHRQSEDIISEHPEHQSEQYASSSWIKEHWHDPQLAGAVGAMQAKIQTGTWLAPGTDQPPATLANLHELKRLKREREDLYAQLDTTERHIAALKEGTGSPTQDTQPDLWDDNIDIQGGTVQVRDARGNTIATLSINSPSLERWLIGAGLVPATPNATPAPTPQTKPSPQTTSTKEKPDADPGS